MTGNFTAVGPQRARAEKTVVGPFNFCYRRSARLRQDQAGLRL